jgi:hypothetical protein
MLWPDQTDTASRSIWIVVMIVALDSNPPTSNQWPKDPCWNLELIVNTNVNATTCLSEIGSGQRHKHVARTFRYLIPPSLLLQYMVHRILKLRLSHNPCSHVAAIQVVAWPDSLPTLR